MQKIKNIADQLDNFAETTGRIISWFSLAMVLITFTVVILRYAFNIGWIAMQESITYLHACLFLLAAAYTLKHDEHVRVDVFYAHMSEYKKAIVNLLGILFLLFPVCGFILWSSLEYVANAWSILEGSREAGGLPAVFLLKTCIPIMTILMMLQGLAQALHAIVKITTHRTASRQDGTSS